ncbi:hypothetical protein D6C91_07890 [Aureobasidium pullulans]|uniref:Cupredoxin n=1 Tax=Aureobasidium pullulans TaxID=5580 RepID=A0A4S9SQ13_AURPU|nr:hypothetical protein D6C91_07890 [Aureobasidium pullulans]
MTALNMKSYTLPIVFSLFGIVNAASHSIDVGEDGLVFSPNSATAAVGDTVTFHFYPRAHGVARSSYPSPCAAMDNGFNSGFVKVASGESNTTFTITVNNTDPIWYYFASELGYSLTGGCGRSSNDQTIGAFIVAASSAGTSTVPEQVYGGVLGAEGSAGGAAVGGSSASASGAGMSSSMMSSSMMSSSMMSSSMAFSMASSSMASSTARSSSSAASAATGSASRSQGSATSGAASATSSIAASTGAASSIKSAGFVQLGLGLLFGGWMFV